MPKNAAGPARSRSTWRTRATHPRALPRSLAWLFPELSVRSLDAERDARFILARVLERGTLAEVSWCLARYGHEGIERFFEQSAHPEVSAKTRRFWRVVLGAREAKWPSAPSFREQSAKLCPS